jgi:hypothetical protein
LEADLVGKVSLYQALKQSVPLKLPLTGHPATEGMTDPASVSIQSHSTAPADVRLWSSFESEVEKFKKKMRKRKEFNTPCVLPLDPSKQMVAWSEAAVTAYQGACAIQVVNEVMR